jgi:hypothetical protein
MVSGGVESHAADELPTVAVGQPYNRRWAVNRVATLIDAHLDHAVHVGFLQIGELHPVIVSPVQDRIGIEIQDGRQGSDAHLGVGSHRTVMAPICNRVRAIMFHAGMQRPGFGPGFTNTHRRIPNLGAVRSNRAGDAKISQ